MKQWKAGNQLASKQYLDKTIKVKAYGSREHMWATAFLKSDLFSKLEK